MSQLLDELKEMGVNSRYEVKYPYRPPRVNTFRYASETLRVEVKMQIYNRIKHWLN